MRLLNIVIFGVISVFLTSCGAHKNVSRETQEPVQKEEISHFEETSEETIIEQPKEETSILNAISRIPDYAMEFLGTRYKYGGNTSEGMDCSGLVTTAFLKEDISLPRTSRDISLQGERINLDEVVRGDLLFFQTNSRRKVINHVGLVVETEAGEIQFIHSTTSRGVIISSLKENYWQENFVMARRIQ